MEKFLIKYSKKKEYRVTTEGDFDDNMPSISRLGHQVLIGATELQNLVALWGHHCFTTNFSHCQGSLNIHPGIQQRWLGRPGGQICRWWCGQPTSDTARRCRSRLWIPTPGFNQSIQGESGKCSSGLRLIAAVSHLVVKKMILTPS